MTLIGTAERHFEAALVSPAILEYYEFPSVRPGHPLFFDLRHGLIRAANPTTATTEVSFVPGTAMFINLDCLGSEAYLREDFFMYHEDVELSMRVLARTNCLLIFCPDAFVWHDSKQSFRRKSTCRLALNNLFTCLLEAQSKYSYVRNYPRYVRTLIANYASYRKYFPWTYPTWGLINLIGSWLWMFRLA